MDGEWRLVTTGHRQSGPQFGAPIRRSTHLDCCFYPANPGYENLSISFLDPSFLGGTGRRSFEATAWLCSTASSKS